MTNDEIMNILLTYDNLKELKYDNNILTYNDKSINIENIPLINFFGNTYSQLFIDQKTISAEDFFNIMELHSKSIEPNDMNYTEIKENNYETRF